MNLQIPGTFGGQFFLVYRGTKLCFIRSKTRLHFIHLAEKRPYLFLSFWKCVPTFLIKRIILTLWRDPSCFFFLDSISSARISWSRRDITQSFALVFKVLLVTLVRENFFLFFIVFHLLSELFLIWSCLLNNLKAMFGSSNRSTSQDWQKKIVTKSRPQKTNQNARFCLEESLAIY